jgi:cystathionine beta-lyase family protein involved in aluminum resistance
MLQKSATIVTRCDDLQKTIDGYKNTDENETQFQKGMREFKKNAKDTLDTLTQYGYDELGQENLETLMRGLRYRDGKSGIWDPPRLDMID